MSAESGGAQLPIDVDSVICNLAAIVRVHEGNRCPLMNKLIESDVPKAREAVAALVEALEGLASAYEKLPGAQTAQGSWHSHAIAALKAAGVVL